MRFFEGKGDSSRTSDDGSGDSLGRVETANTLRPDKSSTARRNFVEGSSRLYAGDQRRYVPMPTGDPKDPLNLPEWRKVLIVSTLCFFGAMAISAEVILAALLPVFVFQYAGFDPHLLDNLDGLPQLRGGGVNPSATSGFAKYGPPLWKVNLITTLPVLVIGVSNYFLVPLSIAIGRRPVIIVCGLLAWCGALWAAASTSLDSHLGARAIQALGAGTVETLLPLVVQDLSFIHWRNRAFSAIWAAQGIVVVTLGICSPLILIASSWRWLYKITAIAAAISWGIILFTLPETRYFRSKAELRGEPLEPLPRGFLRPALNPTRYGRRTWATEFGVFQGGFHWAKAWESLQASVKSFFFPNIFWIICLNGAFAAVSLAAGQTGSSVLLTSPNAWPFRLIGLAVLPIVVASVFVALFAGYGADKVANYITRTVYRGRREPEVHLINMVVPLCFAVAGCVMFGAGGQYIGHISWGVFVVGIGFLSFGVLATNVICSVYAVEAYPDWAGPVLVNSGSFRNIIGFGFSFRVVPWIEQLGFIRMFAAYAAAIAVIGLCGIPVFVWGRSIRKFFGRFVASQERAYGHELMVENEDEPKDGKSGNKDTEKMFTKSDDDAAEISNSPLENIAPVQPRKYKAAEKAGPLEMTSAAELSSRPDAAQRTEIREASNSDEEEKKKKKKKKKKKGKIDWELVKEYLNMRSSWGDPAMH